MNVHGNYYDKYRSKNVLARWLTNGFLTAWSELVGSLDRARPIESILEVGCGDGFLLNFTRQHFNGKVMTIGLEPGILHIRHSRGLTGNFQAVAGSIYELPFDDNSFDLVTVPEVFEHLDDPERGFKEVARVAENFVIASVPWEPVWRMANMLRGCYWGNWGNTPGHVQNFSRSDFARLMQKHTIIEKIRKPFPWTMAVGKVRKAFTAK